MAENTPATHRAAGHPTRRPKSVRDHRPPRSVNLGGGRRTSKTDLQSLSSAQHASLVDALAAAVEIAALKIEHQLAVGERVSRAMRTPPRSGLVRVSRTATTEDACPFLRAGFSLRETAAWLSVEWERAGTWHRTTPAVAVAVAAHGHSLPRRAASAAALTAYQQARGLGHSPDGSLVGWFESSTIGHVHLWRRAGFGPGPGAHPHLTVELAEAYNAAGFEPEEAAGLGRLPEDDPRRPDTVASP